MAERRTARTETHINAILRKLGAHNRTQAMLLARKLLVDPDAGGGG